MHLYKVIIRDTGLKIDIETILQDERDVLNYLNTDAQTVFSQIKENEESVDPDNKIQLPDFSACFNVLDARDILESFSFDWDVEIKSLLLWKKWGDLSEEDRAFVLLNIKNDSFNTNNDGGLIFDITSDLSISGYYFGEDRFEIKDDAFFYCSTDFTGEYVEKNAKVLINRPRGTASANAISYRVSLPIEFAKEMGITEDDRSIKIGYDYLKKTITIKKSDF